MTYYYVEIESSYSREACSFPDLFEAYCYYDKILPGTNNISVVYLYERKCDNTIEFVSNKLLCMRWYDYDFGSILADQDNLHLLLGRFYYKFLSKVKKVNSLTF